MFATSPGPFSSPFYFSPGFATDSVLETQALVRFENGTDLSPFTVLVKSLCVVAWESAKRACPKIWSAVQGFAPPARPTSMRGGRP